MVSLFFRNDSRWGLGYRLVLALLLLAGLGCVIVHRVAPEILSPVKIERIQLFVFPCLLILLWWFRWSAARIPRVVLGLAAVAAFGALAYSYQLTGGRADSELLVGRLSDDQDESQTRIFREGIETLIGDRHLSVQRYFKSIKRDRDARKVFEKQPGLRGIIWGSQRWVNISFPFQSPAEIGLLGEFQGTKRTKQLQIVSEIPIIGLSDSGQLGTKKFISALFQTNDIESALISASGIEGHWTSRAHRAYPAWKLGSNYIVDYLRGGAREEGYLTCAEKSLERADSFLGWGDNPELQAAIFNNQGVIEVLRSEIDGTESHMRKARKLFRAAVGTLRQPKSFDVQFRAAKVSVINLKILGLKSRAVEKEKKLRPKDR